MDFGLNMMDFVLKMMNFGRAERNLPPLSPSNPLWVPPGGGRSLVEEERDGLAAWRQGQDRFNSAEVPTGVGKSLDELPPPPWMMEKAEREFRRTVEVEVGPSISMV